MKLKELKVAIEGVAANGCSLEEKRALESAIRPALVGHFGSLTEQENDAFLDATDSGWYPDTAEEAGRHLKAWRLDNQEHKILAALERAYLAHVKQVEIEFPKTPTEFLGQYQELHSDLCRRRNAGEPVNKAIDKLYKTRREMIAGQLEAFKMLRGMSWADVLEELEACPSEYAFEFVENCKGFPYYAPFEAWCSQIKDTTTLPVKVTRSGNVALNFSCRGSSSTVNEPHTKWTSNDFRG